MAKQMNVDEMLEAAQLASMPGIEHWIKGFEGVANALAGELARHCGVVCGEATFQPGFGGACAPFYAATSGQECPEAMAHIDTGGGWQTREEERAEMDALVKRMDAADARKAKRKAKA